VAVAGLVVVVAVPGLHGLIDDARVAGIGLGLLAYRTLIRIPLGTVVLEELAFRGVLFGAWARVSGAIQAAIGSSVVFGLWHIRPVIELLDVNALAESAVIRIPLVVAAVAITAAGGVLLCALRIRSRSLLAPAFAHAATNSLATVAAFAVRSS
jgi:membrane protease YdiL (CAAX protease family)